jgi:hypothetical protein
MPLIPLAIPPGQYRNANLVRWIEGTVRPVGGWRLRVTVGSNTSVLLRNP